MVDQALPGLGIDQALGQLIDGRVFEAYDIAAAGLVDALRLPILTLLAARGTGLRKTADNHVVVP